MDIFRFIPGYTTTIYDNGREPALVMLLAFLITFICARGYTRMARARGWKSTYLAGVHTHHLVFGLIIAFLAGGLEFALLPQEGFRQLVLAGMFGAGAALVLDEFALVFHLKDVYWEKAGRKSVDAVVMGGAFGLLFLIQAAPFNSADIVPRTALTIIQICNLFFVIVTALKGKLFTAIFGVFVPFLALVGAIRLAEPKSVWSRLFYGPERRILKVYSPKSQKMKRSVARYQQYEKIWKPRKERLWDIFGGKLSHPHR